MPSSRIDCVNIHKINCEFYDENRLCPDNCVGFHSTETVNQNTVSVQMELPIEEETPKRKRG
jgi:hypothetical protein